MLWLIGFYESKGSTIDGQLLFSLLERCKGLLQLPVGCTSMPRVAQGLPSPISCCPGGPAGRVNSKDPPLPSPGLRARLSPFFSQAEAQGPPPGRGARCSMHDGQFGRVAPESPRSSRWAGCRSDAGPFSSTTGNVIAPVPKMKRDGAYKPGWNPFGMGSL